MSVVKNLKFILNSLITRDAICNSHPFTNKFIITVFGFIILKIVEINRNKIELLNKPHQSISPIFIN